jgi:hypothetical protein
MPRVAKRRSFGGCKRGAAAKPADGCGGALKLTTAFHYFECGAKTEKFLEEKWNVGQMTLSDKMRMMEEFRALRAQRKASTSALYAAIAAAFSAVFAAASVIISLIALYSK